MSTVKPVLTTTSEQRPPGNNDHSKSHPNTFRPKVISEQKPLVNYDLKQPLKFGQELIPKLSITTILGSFVKIVC